MDAKVKPWHDCAVLFEGMDAKVKPWHDRARSYHMNLPQHITYGLVVFVAIFLIGWLTGMGGSLIPNLLFSALMGLLAGVCFWAAKRFAGRQK